MGEDHFSQQELHQRTIDDIRKRIVNITYLVLVWFIVPGMILLISRVPEGGWQDLFSVQAVIAIFLVSIAIAKDRIPLNTRSILLTTSLFLSGSASLLSLGVLGHGLLIILGGVLLATLLLSRRWGLVYSIVGGLLIASVYLGEQSGIIERTIDANRYIESTRAWLIVFFVFIMFSAFALFSIGLFYELLNETILALTKRTQELDIANQESQQQFNDLLNMQEKLQLSEMQYDILFENMLDGYMICKTSDGLYEITDVNSAWEQLIKLSKKDSVGRTLYDVLPELETYQSVLDDVIQNNVTARFDQQFAARGNKWFSIAMFSYATKHVAIAFRDITRRKVAVEQLEAYQITLQDQVAERTQELEKANNRLMMLGQSKDEFVSNVSHELRTPLSSFRLNLDMIDKNPSRLGWYKSRLERETDRLEAMIDGLLTLSRLDQDRINVNWELIWLRKFLSEFVEDRHLLADEKGITLLFEDTKEVLAVEADRILLEQVLSILVTNAINYTPSGGVIVVGLFQRGSWTGYYVEDTGPGIAMDDQANLFSRFFRGKVGRKSKVSGTGLGLAIAKAIVDRHQGRIEVESTGVDGDGTTFRVLLPKRVR